MKLVWDEPKRLANIDKHGFDFADLTLDFFSTSLIVPAKKNRAMAIGRFEDRIIAVVFAALGAQGLSVISMRPARKYERKLLDDDHNT